MLTSPRPRFLYPSPLALPPGRFTLDFGKPNMTIANPYHQETPVALASLWTSPSAAPGAVSFLVGGTVGTNGSAHADFGAPGSVWIRYDVPTAASGAVINMTVTIFNKTATRLPEALFVRFNASGAGAPAGLPTWAADKLGGWVDPFDVVMGGNHYHHAVGRRGVLATKPAPGSGGNVSLMIGSPDAAISVWGHPRGLPWPTAGAAEPTEGAGYMVLDNLWGTNYPMWFPFDSADANLQWRFTLAFA
jgi:hypothetical protein